MCFGAKKKIGNWDCKFGISSTFPLIFSLRITKGVVSFLLNSSAIWIPVRFLDGGKDVLGREKELKLNISRIWFPLFFKMRVKGYRAHYYLSLFYSWNYGPFSFARVSFFHCTVFFFFFFFLAPNRENARTSSFTPQFPPFTCLLAGECPRFYLYIFSFVIISHSHRFALSPEEKQIAAVFHT